jgi:hypothetical protein
MGCDLPHPERSARGPEPQVERPVGKWSPRISRKHELRSREGNPAGSQDAAAFKAFLDRLPLEERRTQSPGYRHILEDASLAFDPEGHNFFSYCLAIAPCQLDQFIEPAGGLEEGVGQVEREGRTKLGAMLHSQLSFAITALIVDKALKHRVPPPRCPRASDAVRC